MKGMKAEFKNVYAQIALSEEAKQKLMDLEPSEKRVKKYRVRYAAVAAAAFCIYLASDAVTYAATGEPIPQHISNLITSDEKEDTKEDTKLQLDENGDAVLQDGAGFHMEIEEDTPFDINIYETEDGVQIDIYGEETED